VEGLCGNYNGISSDDIGAEPTLATSLADQTAPWKTIPSCPEPDLEWTTDPCKVRFGKIFNPTVTTTGWLGSRVVSVLDSGAEGPWFKSQPRRCRVTVLG